MKAKVSFKIYDVKAWTTKILQYIYCLISQEKRQPDNEFGMLIEYNRRTIFLEKQYTECGEETSPRSLFIFLKSFF